MDEDARSPIRKVRITPGKSETNELAQGCFEDLWKHMGGNLTLEETRRYVRCLPTSKIAGRCTHHYTGTDTIIFLYLLPDHWRNDSFKVLRSYGVPLRRRDGWSAIQRTSNRSREANRFRRHEGKRFAGSYTYPIDSSFLPVFHIHICIYNPLILHFTLYLHTHVLAGFI